MIINDYDSWVEAMKIVFGKEPFLRQRSPWVPYWENKPIGGDALRWKEFAEIAHKISENGIRTIIVCCDENPNLFNACNDNQKKALLERYKTIQRASSALTAIAVGLKDEKLQEVLLRDNEELKSAYPSSTICEVFNGNETNGWHEWNVFDESFRDWAVGLGLGKQYEEFDIRLNILRFVNRINTIWGNERVIEDSTHVYGSPSWATDFYPVGSPVVPAITELGINLYEMPNMSLNSEMLFRFYNYILSNSTANIVSFFELVSPQFFGFYLERKSLLPKLWSRTGMNQLSVDDPEKKLPGVYTLFADYWGVLLATRTKYKNIEFGGEAPLWTVPVES